MISKNLGLLWLAAALIAIVAFGGTAAAAQATRGSITVSIINDYDVDLNFGPLGKGKRKGVDTVTGILTKQGRNYAGSVGGAVVSTQSVSGLGRGCGPTEYRDSQKLKVAGHSVVGFTSLQHVDWTQSTGRPGTEYIMLEFTPETKTASQPARFDPVTNQLSVKCHDLIIPTPEGADDDDDENLPVSQPYVGPDPSAFNGVAFLPLNDTRWTTRGQGYIIRLPASGILRYKDIHPPGNVGLFKLNKSEWSIQVERLP